MVFVACCALSVVVGVLCVFVLFSVLGSRVSVVGSRLLVVVHCIVFCVVCVCVCCVVVR